MKLILTETQYKRLLTEDTFGRLPDTITPFIVKLFKKMDTVFVPGNNGEQQLRSYLKNYVNLTDKEVIILTNNYFNFKDKDYDSLIGDPLEFYGTYRVRTWMPAMIHARTSITGVIEVVAKSKEEAISNIESGQYEDMYPDPDSPVNKQKTQMSQMDFDLEDIDVMEDMVIDMFDRDDINRETEVTLDEQEDGGTESSSSSGGSSSRWEDMVSPARGVANPIDSSPWDVSPSRGVANPLD